MRKYLLTIHLFGLLCFVSVAVHANELKEVSDKVYDSVYPLYAIDKNKETTVSLGSSVAINKKYLVTNCHVAMAGNFLIVNHNNKPYVAHLCYFNQKDDLCILTVDDLEFKPVKIRDTRTVKAGETVFSVGCSRGKNVVVSAGTVDKLIVMNNQLFLKANIDITCGSSGGGLFDKEGNLIGITTGGILGKPVGYAISTELILEVMGEKSVQKCMLPQISKEANGT